TVQLEAPAAAFTPVPPMAKLPVPATAVMVGAPPQEFTTFGVAAITRPACKLSEKARPLRAGAPAGFVIVNVRVATCPTPTLDTPNALVSVGWPCTVSPVVVTAFVTCAVPTMLPAALLYGPPTTLEVTSTEIAHEACAAFIEAPVTVIAVAAAAAVTTPVPDGHVVVMLGVPATTTLAGRLSWKLMPDCAGLPAPFVSVKVSVDVPPETIAVGAKALLSEACTTLSVWVVTLFVSAPPTVTWPLPLL